MWHGHHPLYGSYPPGLPTAGKPPPLNMVSPAAKIQRTTATVPPMNQVSPSSSITSVNSNNALSATRASSFAAALRKLAKQAGDPPDVGGLLRDSVREPSPVSTCPRTPTPKRAAPAPGVYSSGTSVINSPPVVTIAPTPSHSTTPTESRKSVDRAGAPSSSSTNAAMIEPLGIKTERDKMTASLGSGAGSSAGPGHDRRDEERPHSKDPSHPKPLSAHHMLNNSSAAAPPPGSSSGGSREEAPRGFQPYRPGEDMRHSLPPHFPLDAATAAAAYSAAAAYPAAFMQPHFTHPAFRFDDPLLLERYRMMQSPLMSGLPGYPPSMLHAQGISPLLHPGSRYPPELLAQHYPLMSPKLPDHRSPGASVDRKSEEEERREREGRERHEREERERERERREREEHERRERERQEKERQERERERLERERHERERQERERMERERIERERQLSLERLRAHDAERKSPARNDETGRFGGSITTGTPRDAIYADKYRNAMYPPPRDSLLSKPYSNLSAGVEERLTQSHLADKERGRQFMHEQVRHLYTEQYIRQQEALMREREQEKRDQERREKVTPPTKDDGRHARTSDPSGFHRPFADRPLTNGYEHNHFSDYERRIMTENILAQDRQILQDQQRPRSRPNSGHNGTNHSDSRTYDQVNERSYTEKQHEGMQARLIESEKSREHHAHIYHQRLNQYDYDRPHVEAQPVVASAFSHQNSFNSHSKDSNHLPRNDSRELRVPDPSNYFRFDGPVLSKLDLEEKKIKEARKNGMYDSDNSVSDSEDEAAKEERKKEKLLVISRGPPCKLDKSPKKLKYMHQFGLTTKEERKELDFERFSKRRKLYKESSVSPVKIGDENEMELSFRTDESLSPHPKTGHGFHPDQINREPDYSYKCSFLFKLGLQRVAPERRREMDIIRQVCMEDKRRRLGIKSESNDAFYNSHLPHYPNHILPDQINGLKRKYSELESGSLRPHRPEPQRITLGQLHERHLQTDHSSRPSLSQSSHLPHQQIAPLHQSADSRAVIYPESHDAKLRSREFAQEFHNEVLQATVKKEISKTQQGGSRNGSQSELRYNMDSLESTAYRGPTVSNNTAHSSNVIHSSKMSVTQDDSLSNTPASCKWPGIEAILESYQKHCEEQKMEQGILIEQCQRLQKTNSELHKTAETLSRRMADLMQGKSKSEDDRMNIQTAIDTLKKSLKFLR